MATSRQLRRVTVDSGSNIILLLLATPKPAVMNISTMMTFNSHACDSTMQHCIIHIDSNNNTTQTIGDYLFRIFPSSSDVSQNFSASSKSSSTSSIASGLVMLCMFGLSDPLVPVIGLKGYIMDYI